ncbi:MAG: phosphopantetheine adenylyltransferase [Alphaproteobacteria bacterium]|nr:phosphopantetheine adenylyltransferase [Alphaproteobacteria bacterium]
MSHLIAVLFVAVAIVNLLPVTGVLSAARLEAGYGIPVGDPDLAILLRHRALLFAVVGVLLAGAAAVPGWRGVATAAGLFSMLSFTLLVWTTPGANAQLAAIARIDVVASVALIVAYGLHLRTSGALS